MNSLQRVDGPPNLVEMPQAAPPESPSHLLSEILKKIAHQVKANNLIEAQSIAATGLEIKINPQNPEELSLKVNLHLILAYIYQQKGQPLDGLLTLQLLIDAKLSKKLVRIIELFKKDLSYANQERMNETLLVTFRKFVAEHNNIHLQLLDGTIRSFKKCATPTLIDQKAEFYQLKGAIHFNLREYPNAINAVVLGLQIKSQSSSVKADLYKIWFNSLIIINKHEKIPKHLKEGFNNKILSDQNKAQIIYECANTAIRYTEFEFAVKLIDGALPGLQLNPLQLAFIQELKGLAIKKIKRFAL